jgi:predicted RND superfamily exporter protein
VKKQSLKTNILRAFAMQNPFQWLTTQSVQQPKKALLVGFILFMLLSSGGMHLKFDNSEDGFFPEDEKVDLLYEIEDEYQANIDFVRVIKEIEAGDLTQSSTWKQLVTIEAMMLENEDYQPYHYPLFGTQAQNGPAGHALQWLKYQDEDTAMAWYLPLIAALQDLQTSSNESWDGALANVSSALSLMPTVEPLTSQKLLAWQVPEDGEWLLRLDNHSNMSDELGAMMGMAASLLSNENQSQVGSYLPVYGEFSSKAGPLIGIQSVDFRSSILSSIPQKDADDPWQTSGPILVTLVVLSEPDVFGYDTIGEVQEDFTAWNEELINELQQQDDVGEVRIFSFAQFATGSTATVGQEIGILTSTAFLILGLILWWNFRSMRDTGYVLFLTVVAIIATYGLSGWLQFLGVNMTFNAAMNSIPVLLLAIGVDYGLHVVKRIREYLVEHEHQHPAGRTTLRDFDIELKQKAILHGTILTSVALLIAIFTDVIGFLSFRLSSLVFLQVFGTVIAIGLVFTYLLSISLLPALLFLIPSKKLPIEKSGDFKVGRISKEVGKLAEKPVTVIALVVVLLLPMYAGFQQLEVGFEQRDQFDTSIPIVADFILLSDEYGSSRSPIYVVMDGEIFSNEAREIWNLTVFDLQNIDSTSGVPTGLWSILEQSATTNEHVATLMSGINADDATGWAALKAWVLETEDGRNLTKAVLASHGSQTIISFQANTLDWQATVDLTNEIEAMLSSIQSGQSTVELRISGRSLINAQTTSDVAQASIVSTTVVATIILLMLIGIQTTRTKNVQQGLTRGLISWMPLMMVVVWVYGLMGFTGYQINPQTVTIGALALGLGVDYAVHFATRLEEEAELAPHAEISEWVAKTTATTGRAMGGAALTTAGGFAVLNLSALLPLRLFGQAFVVAIGLALLSSLLILPALYAPLLKRHHASQPTEGEE